MEAASGSTWAGLVFGIVGLLIVVGLLVVGVRVVIIALHLLWRLITWPFRALRPKPPTGAGADYEAMIRQQPRLPVTVTGGSDPPHWPPPPDWQPTPSTPEPAPSRVVLPPPGYRQKEPETHEPETEPVTAAVVAEPTTPRPSTWDRLMRSPVRIPLWLGTPLVWLGVVFLVFKPLGWTSWSAYGLALVAAAVTAVYVYLRYESKTLLRPGKSIVIWVRRRDESASVVIEAREAEDGEPAYLVLRDADKLDDLLDEDLVTGEEYDRLRGATAESPPDDAPTTKTCPDCAETVLAAAKVCRYCHRRFDQSPTESPVVVTLVGEDHPAEAILIEKEHE
jgi:hypothetical protein